MLWSMQSQPGQYSLSMKDGESVRHYRIITDKDGGFQLQGVRVCVFIESIDV